jgi:prevent-host-death family protein
MGVEVGVRELRNNLSQYLERVQSGEEVLVTDRGRAIARVLPLGAPRTLDQLVDEGLITPARQTKRRSRPPIKAAGTVSDLVSDQRR